MLHTRRSLTGIVGIALVALVWMTSGCSDVPTRTSQSSTVRILERPAAAKITADNFLIDSLEFTSAGGTLTVGNETIGYSSIAVPANALSSTVMITMKVYTSGAVLAEMGPEGLEFNSGTTAELTLSYKSADLGGLDPNALGMFYYNEPLDVWDAVTSQPEPAAETVVGELTHFSQYAVGSEE